MLIRKWCTAICISLLSASIIYPCRKHCVAYQRWFWVDAAMKYAKGHWCAVFGCRGWQIKDAVWGGECLHWWCISPHPLSLYSCCYGYYLLWCSATILLRRCLTLSHANQEMMYNNLHKSLKCFNNISIQEALYCLSKVVLSGCSNKGHSYQWPNTIAMFI